MKLHLIALSIALAATTTSAFSLTTILAPDYSGTGLPSGFTSTTANGGTNTFPGNGTQVSSDFSNPGEVAYISGTNNQPMNTTGSYTINATFTPSYSIGDLTNQQDEIKILDLYTPGGADPLLGLNLDVNTYGGGYSVLSLQSGVEYSGSATGNNADYQFGNTTYFDGTFKFTDKLTYSFTPPVGNAFSVPVTITNVGTLSKNGVVVYSFDTVTNGNTVNGDSFEPGTNPLTLQVGVTGNSVASGFFNPGASVTFSNVSVTVPEPSTYALMLGGLALLGFCVRRKLA